MKKIIAFAFVLLGLLGQTSAQELGKLSFTFGYGTVVNNSKFTRGNTQNRMVIESTDKRNQYFSLNAGLAFRDVRFLNGSSNGANEYIYSGNIYHTNASGNMTEEFTESMSVVTGGLVFQVSASYRFMKPAWRTKKTS